MTKKPKVGDLLRYDDHSYCIVTKQVQDYDGLWFWNVEWILCVDPRWYEDEESRLKYYMEHFSYDSWANLSG
jgi:hypothetical protein